MLLRPDVLLANLLNRAVGILSGASDDRPVDVPVSWKPWEYRTVRTALSEALALGAEAPLRYIQSGFDDFGVLSQEPIRAPQIVKEAGNTVARFVIDLHAAAGSDSGLSELARRMVRTEAARRRAWTLNEKAVSEELGLPSRESSQHVGKDLYWEHHLLKDPTTLTREVVTNPKTATAAGFITNGRLLFDVANKQDLAWAVLVALEAPLQKGVTALLDLFTLGTMGRPIEKAVSLLMPSNLYALVNSARWVETFVVKPLMHQQAERFLLASGVGAVAAVDALVNEKLSVFAEAARKQFSGANAKKDFAQQVQRKNDKENNRKKLIAQAREGTEPPPPAPENSKIPGYLQQGAALVWNFAADQVPVPLPVPTLQQLQVGANASASRGERGLQRAGRALRRPAPGLLPGTQQGPRGAGVRGSDAEGEHRARPQGDRRMSLSTARLKEMIGAAAGGFVLSAAELAVPEAEPLFADWLGGDLVLENGTGDAERLLVRGTLAGGAEELSGLPASVRFSSAEDGGGEAYVTGLEIAVTWPGWAVDTPFLQQDMSVLERGGFADPLVVLSARPDGYGQVLPMALPAAALGMEGAPGVPAYVKFLPVAEDPSDGARARPRRATAVGEFGDGLVFTSTEGLAALPFLAPGAVDGWQLPAPSPPRCPRCASPTPPPNCTGTAACSRGPVSVWSWTRRAAGR
ncbi:hypothetical protein [Streptantibioticus cattleyicolor]|nr:hypothetical protein [Streptantibioticus cattleyicolor]